MLQGEIKQDKEDREARDWGMLFYKGDQRRSL